MQSIKGKEFINNIFSIVELIASKHPDREDGQFIKDAISGYRHELNVPMKKKEKIIPFDLNNMGDKAVI